MRRRTGSGTAGPTWKIAERILGAGVADEILGDLLEQSAQEGSASRLLLPLRALALAVSPALAQAPLFEVEEAGSVSRAAERLNLSQPAVSVALGNLEAELGFRLFHRERGFFAPTSEAALLHDNVQQGVAALARLEQRADEVRSGTTGRVSVATNGVLALNFLPRIIADFQREHPGAHIDMRTARRRATELLDYVGLLDVADNFPATLSGGELQRVVFARALVRDPQIIFADEPTGSLDAENSHRLLALLRDQIEAGKLVIMATHDSEAMKYATRTVSLDKFSRDAA